MFLKVFVPWVLLWLQVLSFNKSFWVFVWLSQAFSASAGFSVSFLFPLYSFVFSLSFHSYNLLGMRSLGSFIAFGAVINPYFFSGRWDSCGFFSSESNANLWDPLVGYSFL